MANAFRSILRNLHQTSAWSNIGLMLLFWSTKTVVYSIRGLKMEGGVWEKWSHSQRMGESPVTDPSTVLAQQRQASRR